MSKTGPHGYLTISVLQRSQKRLEALFGPGKWTSGKECMFYLRKYTEIQILIATERNTTMNEGSKTSKGKAPILDYNDYLEEELDLLTVMKDCKSNFG